MIPFLARRPSPLGFYYGQGSGGGQDSRKGGRRENAGENVTSQNVPGLDNLASPDRTDTGQLLKLADRSTGQVFERHRLPLFSVPIPNRTRLARRRSGDHEKRGNLPRRTIEGKRGECLETGNLGSLASLFGPLTRTLLKLRASFFDGHDLFDVQIVVVDSPEHREQERGKLRRVKAGDRNRTADDDHRPAETVQKNRESVDRFHGAHFFLASHTGQGLNLPTNMARVGTQKPRNELNGKRAPGFPGALFSRRLPLGQRRRDLGGVGRRLGVDRRRDVRVETADRRGETHRPRLGLRVELGGAVRLDHPPGQRVPLRTLRDEAPAHRDAHRALRPVLGEHLAKRRREALDALTGGTDERSIGGRDVEDEHLAENEVAGGVVRVLVVLGHDCFSCRGRGVPRLPFYYEQGWFGHF